MVRPTHVRDKCRPLAMEAGTCWRTWPLLSYHPCRWPGWPP